MEIRDAVPADIQAITDIYNHAVLYTSSIWTEAQVDAVERQDWLADRNENGYPVLVAVDESNEVLGYASFGDWRPKDGYRNTVEHSVYVHINRRGVGIGETLMRALIPRAQKLGKHVMVAAIEAKNFESIKLHKKLDFEMTGHMKEVGIKFGVWLDLALMQLALDDRKMPNEG